MSAGEGMLYPVESVDGVVTAIGGRALRKLCAEAVAELPGGRLEPGQAAITLSGGLERSFGYIIHTVPPFASDPDCDELAAACYHSVVALGRRHDIDSLALPLLGTGSRGQGLQAGAKIAARALGACGDGRMLHVCVVVNSHDAEQGAGAALDDEFSSPA